MSTALEVEGAYVLSSPVWPDERGFFREWFQRAALEELGVEWTLAQANLSMSARDVVRGLHYSLASEGQAKLVTCAYGTLVDVVVDVREGSPSFGAVATIELAADAGRAVFLPAGVAHGFCVTSEEAALCYLLSSPYNAAMELEIDPFDPALAVPWPLSGPAKVSDKDRRAPRLSARRAAGELPRYRA
ncbi:MAG: dTDP-4-dehydrorhamnose 3,5-epimerase family protein [Acidimicrobiales bacterium]